MAPGPQSHKLLGHIGELKRHFLSTTEAWHANYGNIVRFRLGPKYCYLINHAQLAEQVLIARKEDFVKIHDPDKPRGLGLILGNGLLTSTGVHWHNQRRMLQPVFHRSQITKMTGSIVRVGGQLLERWSVLDHSQSVDVSEQMTQVTLEVITRTMFGSSVQAQYKSLAPAFRIVSEYAQNCFINPLKLPLFVPTRSNRTFKRAVTALQNIIIALIDKRESSGAQKKDLLSLLLEARNPDSGEAMPVQQVIDEALTIFTAGHETTANVLSWTWYLLALHPQLKSRFHAEIDQVLGGRAPSVEDLARLPYTKAILEEAMRLYPPAAMLMRKACEASELDGYPIPKGALIMVNIRNIHRNPMYWDNPGKFDPNRMLGDARSQLPRLAFMPFGAGPRVCIGNHLAMNEALLLMAQIGSRFDLTMATAAPIAERMSITLRPAAGLPMYIAPRPRIQ